MHLDYNPYWLNACINHYLGISERQRDWIMYEWLYILDILRCLRSCKQWSSTVLRCGTILSSSFQSHCRPELVPVPVIVWLCRQPKALLQLKESSPDEFLRLIESARSASSEKTDVRTQSESEETTMETSSDTGSIVREVNRQLEEESTLESSVRV